VPPVDQIPIPNPDRLAYPLQSSQRLDFHPGDDPVQRPRNDAISRRDRRPVNPSRFGLDRQHLHLAPLDKLTTVRTVDHG